MADGRQPVRGDLARDPDGQAGPGEGVAPHDLLRQAQRLADRPHLILEQHPQRLQELEMHFLGQAAHVVMGLDRVRRTLFVARGRLDHIRIQRALRQERGVRPGGSPWHGRGGLRLGRFEGADEPGADAPAFFFWIDDARQVGQERGAGIDGDQVRAQALPKSLFDLGSLALASRP